jgi:hypothetical protein
MWAKGQPPPCLLLLALGCEWWSAPVSFKGAPKRTTLATPTRRLAPATRTIALVKGVSVAALSELIKVDSGQRLFSFRQSLCPSSWRKENRRSRRDAPKFEVIFTNMFGKEKRTSVSKRMPNCCLTAVYVGIQGIDTK